MKTINLTDEELEMLQDNLLSLIEDKEALSGDTDYLKGLRALYKRLSDNDTPKIGEIYRHFKGGYYKIIAVGHHSETKERMVVYSDLSCRNSSVRDPCIRPLDMFMSEVDHNKYPDAEQEYRFEKVM